MNDRAAVKSPENPGFKPKNRSLQNRALRVPCLVPLQDPDPVENGRVSTKYSES